MAPLIWFILCFMFFCESLSSSSSSLRTSPSSCWMKTCHTEDLEPRGRHLAEKHCTCTQTILNIPCWRQTCKPFLLLEKPSRHVEFEEPVTWCWRNSSQRRGQTSPAGTPMYSGWACRCVCLLFSLSCQL